MRNWIIGLIAASAVALTGCSSTCDTLSETSDTYVEKAKPCESADYQPTAFNVTQCDRTIDQCTDAELEALDEYIDCLDKLEACTPGTKDAFKNAEEACDDYMKSKVGDSCRQIFR